MSTAELDEAERLWTKQRVLDLLDELAIAGATLREEMLRDPERARAVLTHAKGSAGIRNVAAFAVANWRAGFDPRDRVVVDEPELTEAAPTLSALELAWHLEGEGSFVAAPVLAMMRVAIARTGGCRRLLDDGFYVRETRVDDEQLELA